MSNSSHTVIIGVDGDGTGCRVAIGTAADGVLARVEGGRANVASDPVLANKNVIATVKAAAINDAISVGPLYADDLPADTISGLREREGNALAHLGTRTEVPA